MLASIPRDPEFSDLDFLATMRVVRLFLRARAVINFVLRAASTLANTDGDYFFILTRVSLNKTPAKSYEEACFEKHS